MEHGPYDIRALRDCLQYMLNRRQIVSAARSRPPVTPARAHPAERRRAEPVDRQAGAGHRRVRRRLAARQHRRGGAQRGASPAATRAQDVAALRAGRAARRRARRPPRATGASRSRSTTRRPTSGRSRPTARCSWSIMCEEARAIKNLPEILREVPGIGVVLIGEGDLSQDLGYPRQYEHPTVAAAIERDPGDLQGRRRAVRPPARRLEQRRATAGAGLPLADGRARADVQRAGAGPRASLAGSRPSREVRRVAAARAAGCRAAHCP